MDGMTLDLPFPAAGTTRLILVRHGEPDEAVRNRCYGRLDPGLSSAGREQMRRTWRLLSGEPAAIYSSPSRRAVESVNLRASAAPAVTIEGRLREIDFGEFEGLAYRDIAQRFPETYAEWMTRPTEVTFPGGENLAAMTTRVQEALACIRQRHAGMTVAVVSHGGVNRIALAMALGLEPRVIFRLAQSYACVNVIDYIGDEPSVLVMNATFGPC
jgi:ribonuclease H / adenosylcobalamin/alpha-ribazole phosphatase